MIKEKTLSEPLITIEKIIHERYKDAKAIFWAGSVSKNQGTSASDLDLVIVYEKIPNAYREAFIYDGWPIDIFVHDITTLHYFFEESRIGNGISGLIEMILYGKEVLGPNSASQDVYKLAKNYRRSGPNVWSQAQIDKERFLITDILDDIKFPNSKEEQITSAVHLYEPLIQFYFRANKRWAASGKSLIRLLKAENPNLAREFNESFEKLFQTGDALGIEEIVKKILSPYGGLFWDGFRSDAHAGLKVLDKNSILEELKSREPIFHHPEKFGKTRQDIENQMCNKFWEVGASGNIYTKEDVINNLLERYNDSNYEDIWEAKDFKLTPIAKDSYLLTYTLIQNKTRVTRRSTMWQNVDGSWKILYHQGTVIDVSK
ncbi:MAG: DUF4440 domain-containing protein [Janthinobacterium lividum]